MSDTKRPTVAELEARADQLEARVRLVALLAVAAVLIALAARGEVVRALAEVAA